MNKRAMPFIPVLVWRRDKPHKTTTAKINRICDQWQARMKALDAQEKQWRESFEGRRFFRKVRRLAEGRR